MVLADITVSSITLERIEDIDCWQRWQTSEQNYECCIQRDFQQSLRLIMYD